MHEHFPGKIAQMITSLFARGEAMDADAFTRLFTESPLYQFGNADICYSKPAISASTNAFFSQIDALYHDIKMIWETGNTAFVEMDVMYWRKDGSMVRLPCADIFRVEGNRFSELRIFMDANPLSNREMQVPEGASVFGLYTDKSKAISPIMTNHFLHSADGVSRLAQGYVPKWATNGPRWELKALREQTGQMQADLVY